MGCARHDLTYPGSFLPSLAFSSLRHASSTPDRQLPLAHLLSVPCCRARRESRQTPAVYTLAMPVLYQPCKHSWKLILCLTQFHSQFPILCANYQMLKEIKKKKDNIFITCQCYISTYVGKCGEHSYIQDSASRYSM